LSAQENWIPPRQRSNGLNENEPEERGEGASPQAVLGRSNVAWPTWLRRILFQSGRAVDQKKIVVEYFLFLAILQVDEVKRILEF
jgi:hypothetical protein